MSLGRKDIVKNINSKALISSSQSKLLLSKLINIICTESLIRPVKISNFGTFYIHKSPKRLGRNPKTKEEFVIKERKKLSLSISNNVKKFFN